jgi:hypothetical protein
MNTETPKCSQHVMDDLFAAIVKNTNALLPIEKHDYQTNIKPDYNNCRSFILDEAYEAPDPFDPMLFKRPRNFSGSLKCGSFIMCDHDEIDDQVVPKKRVKR